MPPLMGDAQVVINTRTLRIGHQTFSLENIARVQTVLLPKPSWADKGNAALSWVAGIGLYLFVILPIAGNVGSGTVGFLGLIPAVGVGILIYKKTTKPYAPRYALILETTGNPQTALVSPDHAELSRVSARIIEAIENPPQTEQVIQVHNVILGDQYNQEGNYNIGRVGRS